LAQLRLEIPIHGRIARGIRGVKEAKNELLAGGIRSEARRDWRTVMLWTILAILVVLWLLGLLTSYTMGGLIHLLLVVAVIIVIIRLVSGRRSR
jgi:quinol-cytochrome oxidoreductase complex cytochrome b subunit